VLQKFDGNYDLNGTLNTGRIRQNCVSAFLDQRGRLSRKR